LTYYTRLLLVNLLFRRQRQVIMRYSCFMFYYY